jgi:hypothetical protein
VLETPEEEIERLEGERHRHSETFRNTDPGDTVTRTALQQEMDQRTRRIQELQSEEPMSFLGKLGCWGLAAAAAFGTWELHTPWLRIVLGVIAGALVLATYD